MAVYPPGKRRKRARVGGLAAFRGTGAGLAGGMQAGYAVLWKVWKGGLPAG